jgi:hypothetical protein
MNILMIIIVIFLFVWILWSSFADTNLESPRYICIERKSGYEIRKYDSYVTAETTVMGNSQGLAFRELGGYIFGANRGNKNIAMTAPITTQQTGQSIAMTAPVTTKKINNMMTMSFMMPSEFTIKNLPTANSENISFQKVPSGTFAILSFTGFAGDKKTAKKIKKLQKILQRDGITILSEAQLLQYNRPTMFPLLRTNEIKIEIEYTV